SHLATGRRYAGWQRLLEYQILFAGRPMGIECAFPFLKPATLRLCGKRQLMAETCIQCFPAGIRVVADGHLMENISFSRQAGTEYRISGPSARKRGTSNGPAVSPSS